MKRAWMTQAMYTALGCAIGALATAAILTRPASRQEAAVYAQAAAQQDSQEQQAPSKQFDNDRRQRRGEGRLNIVPGPNVKTPDAEHADRPSGAGADVRPGLSPRRIDMIERCLEVAQDIDPAVARQLRALREREPVEFERTVRQVGRRLMILADLKARDVEMYKARIGELQSQAQINRTANDLCTAREAGDAAEVSKLEELLKNQLTVQLTYSIKARTEYLCRLREQVTKVEGEISHDAASFAAIVEERYQAILSRPPCDPLDVLKGHKHNEGGADADTAGEPAP